MRRPSLVTALIPIALGGAALAAASVVAILASANPSDLEHSAVLKNLYPGSVVIAESQSPQEDISGDWSAAREPVDPATVELVTRLSSPQEATSAVAWYDRTLKGAGWQWQRTTVWWLQGPDANTYVSSQLMLVVDGHSPGPSNVTVTLMAILEFTRFARQVVRRLEHSAARSLTD